MPRTPATIRNLVLLGAVFAVLAAPASAFPPPRPGIYDPLTQRFRTTGAKFPYVPPQVKNYRRLTPLGGKYPLAPRPKAARDAAARPLAVDPRAQGAVRPLVLLIDFDDLPAQQAPAIADPAAFVSLFFGSSASDLSVKNYWEEQSYTRQGTFNQLPRGTGRTFTVSGSAADVKGWLRAGTTFSTTITSFSQISGVQPANVRQLLADAVAYLAGQGVDFSPYVGSGGTFQAVVIVHPGYGQEDTGDPGDPYSHTAPITPIPAGGGEIADYSLVPALQSPLDPARRDRAADARIGAGVVVHEMGHLLGLPDLYPAGAFGQVAPDNVFSGAGVFDLMAYGLWGSNILARPDTPAHLSAWSKAFLGWLNPADVTATGPRTLRPVEFYPEADKILSNTAADPTQYFLVENREVGSQEAGVDWLFDRFLPGAGGLIWQIDEEVINAHLDNNTVNSNRAFRGVYVKEADGVADTAQTIPDTGTPNDLARFFGDQPDYFSEFGQVFDREHPSAAVNSAPVVDNSFTFHPVDFGANVQLLGWTRTASNALQYVGNLSGAGAGGAPSWKTFNVASTTAKYPFAPMRSDDILSIAFDSGNNVWLGSRDQGIFRFLGGRFDILTAVNAGLPAGAGTPVARIQAMAFENDTGSMWVGTDRGLYKMRDSGAGFRVQSSFTETSASPRKLPAGGNDVRAVAVRGGFAIGSSKIDIKYAATPAGLVRIDDRNTDAEPDDFAGVVKAGDATAVAVDDEGTPASAADDIVWVGFANGDVYRSRLPREGGPSNNDPVADSDFKFMFNLTGARITTLAVDKKGRLWVGTDTRGVLVFDLGEHLDPPAANLDDPLGVDVGDGMGHFLSAARGMASDHATGIAFQALPSSEVVAWVSHLRDFAAREGGVSRFDANAANDNATPVDERVTVFRPEAGVLPENQVNGPASASVGCAAADSAGNVWFGTTAPGAAGASRFGNAGVLSLDRSNYVNLNAVATVTLQDDGLNTSDNVVNIAVARVTSGSDSSGIFLILTETGPDTGVFDGTFGFTTGASVSGGALPLINVSNGTTVTVRYQDFDPPGTRTAQATWKSVFPFSDSLWIPGGCFVATAAYGSAAAPEVVLFRAFRDRFLISTRAGRAFVAAYYALGPAVAAFVAPRPLLRAAARFLLAPCALAVKVAQESGPAEAVAAFAVLAFLVAALARTRRKRETTAARAHKACFLLR